MADSPAAGSTFAQERSFWDNPGRHLPSLPSGLINFAAGFGDGISFGITKQVREARGFNDVVNEDSATYRISELAGNFHIALTGSGLALSPLRNAGTAATAIGLTGLTSSASNHFFNPGSIPGESVVLDTLNVAAPAAFRGMPGGSIGTAIINLNFTTTSFLMNNNSE